MNRILIFATAITATVASHNLQAATCKVNCSVHYAVDLGTTVGTGKTCSDAYAEATKACRAKREQVWSGGTMSCVELGTGYGQGAEVSSSCFGMDADSKLVEVYASDANEAHKQGRELCNSWCESYPKNSNGKNDCRISAGACVP